MPTYCRISFCAMIRAALVSPAAAQATDEETLDTITVHGAGPLS